MSLNKEKVINYINAYLESEKNYYPKAIFEDVKIDVYYQSFGACGVRIEGKYNETSKEGIYRYKDIDILVFKWCNNSQHRFLENYYTKTQKEPLKYGFQFLNELHAQKTSFNCSYYEMKSENKSDLLICFLGTAEFIITNNFWGCLAVGVRSWNYDEQKATYKVQIKADKISRSRLAKLCQTYEKKRLKTQTPQVDFIEE